MKKSLVEELVGATQPALEHGLAEAERELHAARAKVKELEQYIDAARRLLSLGDSGGAGGSNSGASAQGGDRDKPLTLHEAMALVLRQAPDGMKAPEIAAEVNRRGLYFKQDGSPVDPHQIHARVGGYYDMFEKKNGRIFVRHHASQQGG